MKKTTFIKLFSLLTLISLITIYSCSSDDVDVNQSFSLPNLKDNQNSNLSDEVPVELTKKIALNFIKGKDFDDNYSDETYLKKNNNSQKKQKTKKIDDILVVPDANGNPMMYVVNFKPKGHVIISTTKKETPILGYSSTSNFDLKNLPLGFADWLLNRIDRIQKLKADKDSDIPEVIANQWSMLESMGVGAKNETIVNINGLEFKLIKTKTIQKGPLLNTQWGQGAGYNNYMVFANCSSTSNGRYLTGCVTTAISQIVRYHEYPNLFNWDIMPNVIRYGKDKTQGANEISKLMLGVYQILRPKSTCKATGSNIEAAQNTFKVLGYPLATISDFNYLILKNQLDAKLPVYMRGGDINSKKRVYFLGIDFYTWYDSNHAWVVDGYRENYYTWDVRNPKTNQTVKFNNGAVFLHMNWGWNSLGMGAENNDGWYLFGDYTIKGVPNATTKRDYNFIAENKMIFGLLPNKQ